MTTMFNGTPVRSAFPKWVAPSQEFEVAHWCPAELAVWRSTVEKHKNLPSMNQKLELRPKLESAWKWLKVAYETAISQPAMAA